MPNLDRKLLAHGLALLLIGLLTGLAIPVFTVPRLGLAAHIAGVSNGTLLIVLALAWKRIGLRRGVSVAYRLLLFSTYSIWAANVAAGAFGTSLAAPIAGAGYGAEPWQEYLVLGWLAAAALAILVATAQMLVAAVRRARSD